MIREHVQATIDMIKLAKADPNFDFDMTHYAYTIVTHETACGTAACIGGYALMAKIGALTSVKEIMKHYTTSVPQISILSQYYLGLTEEEAERLFTPFTNAERYQWVEQATADQAIRVLEYLLHTGEIEWNVANE